jgi:hypothetical protein
MLSILGNLNDQGVIFATFLTYGACNQPYGKTLMPTGFPQYFL